MIKKMSEMTETTEIMTGRIPGMIEIKTKYLKY